MQDICPFAKRSIAAWRCACYSLCFFDIFESKKAVYKKTCFITEFQIYSLENVTLTTAPVIPRPRLSSDFLTKSCEAMKPGGSSLKYSSGTSSFSEVGPQ